MVPSSFDVALIKSGPEAVARSNHKLVAGVLIGGRTDHYKKLPRDSAPRQVCPIYDVRRRRTDNKTKLRIDAADLPSCDDHSARSSESKKGLDCSWRWRIQQGSQTGYRALRHYFIYFFFIVFFCFSNRSLMYLNFC